MYFPKLENLYKEKELSDFSLIIDALDSWLALLPKSYKDRITPELFSVKQHVQLDISYMLFHKLVELNIIKERYVLECKCGQVIKFEDSLNKVFDFIVKFNDSEFSCSACNENSALSTDNVFSIYKLIEVPAHNVELKKKGTSFINDGIITKTKSLSDRILSEPMSFVNEYGKESLLQVAPQNVRKEIEWLLNE